MLFLSVISLHLSFGLSIWHRSEFCNSSTAEISVDSSGHLEGVIFSPKYPESRNGDYNENLHEFQHIVPEFKLGRSENCSIRAVEKMIWGQSMIHIGLDRSLHSHERFIIKYEVSPGFIAAPHDTIHGDPNDQNVTAPGTIYRIDVRKYPRGFVGMGLKYYLNTVHRFEPSQQSRYGDRSSGSSTFPHPSMLNDRIIYLDRMFLFEKFTPTATLTCEFKYLKYANQSRTPPKVDKYHENNGFDIYYFNGITAHIDHCASTRYSGGIIKFFPNTSMHALIRFTYGRESLVATGDITGRQPDDGFILRFTSESCEDDIKNVKGIERLLPSRSGLFRVHCLHGYELKDQSVKVYRCVGTTWSPQKPACLTVLPRNEESNYFDITESPRSSTSETQVESDELTSVLFLPLSVTLGITVILLLISTIYIILLKSQLARAQNYRASSMVDVVIPRETGSGNVLSLPSSYNTDPGMQSQVAIPVEFGAALDPDIPSPPLTPHPLKRYRSKKQGSYKSKPGNQVDTSVQQISGLMSYAHQGVYHDSHHCLDITPATEGKDSSIDQSQSSTDLNRSGSTISDSNRSVSPLGDKSMTGGGNSCINIMSCGTTSGGCEVQDQGNYTPTTVISDNLSEDNPAFDNDD